ncbi:hypothetical protein BC831DRAFT_456461 [Entophlyctis helioformis]|nr:hypothetical protein BC831DRAFT_456461 [Entophlyctis helioformis]
MNADRAKICSHTFLQTAQLQTMLRSTAVKTLSAALGHGTVAARATRIASFSVSRAARSSAHHHGSETLTPAVASIVGKHHIASDIVARIPRSGPKGRLLKGDVLAYISNPGILAGPGASAGSADGLPFESVPMQYYAVAVNPALLACSILDGKPRSAQDVIASAVGRTLQQFPKINASFDASKKAAVAGATDRMLLTRESAFGPSTMALPLSNKLSSVAVGKAFRDDSTAAGKTTGLFRLHDYTALQVDEVPSPYLSSKDTAILTVCAADLGQDAAAASSADSDAAFDELLGIVQKHSEPASTPSSIDLFAASAPSASGASSALDADDGLFGLASPSPSAFPAANGTQSRSTRLVFELTVDRRAVDDKTAHKFLETLRNTLERDADSL